MTEPRLGEYWRITINLKSEKSYGTYTVWELVDRPQDARLKSRQGLWRARCIESTIPADTEIGRVYTININLDSTVKKWTREYWYETEYD